MEVDLPPRRGPTLVGDLGRVAAASIERDRRAWALAFAAAASTAGWAGVDVATLWCAPAVAVALRVPILPRRMLSGGWVAVVCACLGLAFAALRSDRWPASMPYWAVLGTGHAMLVPWAAATAHALRRRVRPAHAEEASARLAVWAQEHPWRTVLGLVLLVGPCGALAAEAVMVHQRLSGEADLVWGAGLGAGSLLLLAASLQGRLLRVAEKAVPALAIAAVVWLALVWATVGSGSLLEAAVTATLTRVGVAVAALAAVEWGARAFGGRGLSPERVSLTALLALLAHAAATQIGPGPDLSRPVPSAGPWLEAAVREVPFAVVLVVLACSTLRGRAVLAVGAGFGAAATLLADAVQHRDPPSLARAAVGALLCANQAVFVLAARRVRSLTVVPADHALRADWGVDLRRPGTPC